LKRLADATKQTDGAFAELADTVLLPDTEQGRAAAAEIDRLTAARSIDYAAIERRVMQHVSALVTRREARNGRRRSRQCRGPRARNYTRANARAKLGASATGGEASVYVDAVRSGAYAVALWKAVS
jgi:hypothetical protein